VPCIEIMTGASFPSSSDSTPDFDACIPYEQVQIRSESIQITRPPKPKQHRRPAGDDLPKGNALCAVG
jgi:molybdopterin biosynthesis enzyme